MAFTTGTGVVTNDSLIHYSMTNTGTAALDHRKFVSFDKTARDGMVAVDDTNANGVAGVLEDRGMDTTGFVALTNMPAGQTGRVRKRGATMARCVAVAVLRGDPAYVVMSSTDKGRVTNVSTNNTLVGTFLAPTGGTLDEMAEVDLNLH